MRTMITSLAMAMAMALAGVASAAGSPDQCFRSTDYQGFRAIDEHAFIIRTNLDQYFRIDVEGSCPELTRPGAALVMVVRASPLICNRLDWDLRVGQLGPTPFTVGCLVKSQRRLTAAEVKALPPKQRP